MLTVTLSEFMNNNQRVIQPVNNARKLMRKLLNSSSPVKLMIMAMATVLIMISLLGLVRVRYHVRIPIPPMAIGGGIDMSLDMFEAEANYSKPDSIRVRRLMNNTK